MSWGGVFAWSFCYARSTGSRTVTFWNHVFLSLVVSNVIPGNPWCLCKSPDVSWFILTSIVVWRCLVDLSYKILEILERDFLKSSSVKSRGVKCHSWWLLIFQKVSIRVLVHFQDHWLLMIPRWFLNAYVDMLFEIQVSLIVRSHATRQRNRTTQSRAQKSLFI